MNQDRHVGFFDRKPDHYSYRNFHIHHRNYRWNFGKEEILKSLQSLTKAIQKNRIGRKDSLKEVDIKILADLGTQTTFAFLILPFYPLYVLSQHHIVPKGVAIAYSLLGAILGMYLFYRACSQIRRYIHIRKKYGYRWFRVELRIPESVPVHLLSRLPKIDVNDPLMNPANHPGGEFPKPEVKEPVGVGFFEAARLGFVGYSTFSGRCKRSEYWKWICFVWIVALGLGEIMAITPKSNIVPGLLFFVFVLGSVVPCLAVSTRRLRDAGLNPYLVLVIAIPAVGLLALFVLCCFPTKETSHNQGTFPYTPDSAQLPK